MVLGGGGWLVGGWCGGVLCAGGRPLFGGGAAPLVRSSCDQREGAQWPPVGSPRSQLPAVRLFHRLLGTAVLWGQTFAVPAQIEHLKLFGGSTADTTCTRWGAVDVLRLSVLSSTARPRGTGPRFRPRFASACSPGTVCGFGACSPRVNRVRQVVSPAGLGAATNGPWGPHLGSLPFLCLLGRIGEQFSVGHVAGTKIVSTHNDRRGRAGHVRQVTRSCVGTVTLPTHFSSPPFSMCGWCPADSSGCRSGGHADFRA